MTFAEVPVKRMGFAALVTSLIMALSLAPLVFAQTGVGSVRGNVTDSQGGTIAQADVTLTSPETAYSRTEKTDANGNYSFQSIPIGRYTLSVSREGFKTFEEKDVILHVNDNLTLDAHLNVGARTEL